MTEEPFSEQLMLNIQKPLVIFDGHCLLCDKSVQFLLRNDSQNRLMFCSFQSGTGRNILKEFNFSSDTQETVIFIKNNKAYQRSDAIIEIMAVIEKYKCATKLFKLLPKFLRDAFYNLTAKYRYFLFGKNENCLIPTPETEKKFLK